MSDNISRLEVLPNEVLLDILEYFDGRDLYRTFYKLNSRFELLLQSFKHLYLHIRFLRYKNTLQDTLFASRVHKLIIDRNRFIYDLYQFPNIRNLIFIKSSAAKMEQIIDQINNLEHLTIKIKQLSSMLQCSLYQRIFSNDFPNLKSCILTSFEPQSLVDKWTQSPSICSLHIVSNYSRIHVSILAACPNLYFLKLSIPKLAQTPTAVPVHNNLKRLVLTFTSDARLVDDSIFDGLFACVPNLERLGIHRLMIDTEGMNTLIKSDWFADILTHRLPVLHQFKLTLRLRDYQDFDSLEQSFLKAHKYECELRIVL